MGFRDFLVRYYLVTLQNGPIHGWFKERLQLSQVRRELAVIGLHINLQRRLELRIDKVSFSRHPQVVHRLAIVRIRVEIILGRLQPVVLGNEF